VDKGLTKFMKGRLAIAAVMAVCLIALPAMAFAASTNNYPSGSTAAPSVVGVTFTGVLAKTAAITIDGGARVTKMSSGASVAGAWSTQSVLVGSVFKIQWVWTPGTFAAGQVKVYAFPTSADVAAGSHTVVANVYDSTGALADTLTWTYNVDSSITPGTPDGPGTAVPAADCGASCHVDYNKKAGMGPHCANCHSGAEAPAHGYIAAGDHTAETAYLVANAQGCVTCHGSDLLNVSAGPHTISEHAGCSCHTYGEATALKTCQDCHQGEYAPHGFVNGLSHGGSGWFAASGHNTTAFGTIGAKEIFNGDEGVTLHGAAFARGDGAPTGAQAVLETTWQFPSANVFWKAGDAEAPADALFLNKDSVVTCQDCHTGFAAAGPHGSADNFGLDADYPADYSYAELTKWIVTNPSGIKVRSSLGTETQTFTSGNTVICSKCHDLQNYAEGNTLGTTIPKLNAMGFINVTAVGGSNTAHTSHHQDNADGSAQCVNCHIGVPHGWSRPRLLVNTAKDAAPYLDPDHLGTSRTNNRVMMFAKIGGVWTFTGRAAANLGWNRMGMQSLSAEDNHSVNASGWAAWTEADCDACNDHAADGSIESTTGVTVFDPVTYPGTEVRIVE